MGVHKGEGPDDCRPALRVSAASAWGSATAVDASRSAARLAVTIRDGRIARGDDLDRGKDRDLDVGWDRLRQRRRIGIGRRKAGRNADGEDNVSALNATAATPTNGLMREGG
jgi:hypothetical protein